MKSADFLNMIFTTPKELNLIFNSFGVTVHLCFLPADFIRSYSSSTTSWLFKFEGHDLREEKFSRNFHPRIFSITFNNLH